MSIEKRRPVNVETDEPITRQGTISDHTHIIDTKLESSDDAVQNQLKKLVSGEVSRAIEALAPTLLDKVTESIRHAVNNEFTKRKDGTSMENRTKNAIQNNQNLDNNFGYSDFSACDPPKFQREQDRIISYKQLLDIEEAFNVSRYKFLKVFAPEAEVKKIRREFMVKGRMTKTVGKFTGWFMDRARFLPEYANDDKKLTKHYKEMLRKDIREFLGTYNYRNFNELMHATLDREHETMRDVPSPQK
ncbi:hypothetical protein Tco_1132583 [Tanacetum coccineum]|uniref:Uncharacterized protein n=1 Tax=Tanacetum coccineum TaxID=301880 RepID=A0ABQ5JF39_9ASTR